MLDSTFELISLAASNSLAAFCFCNLIIAFLLVSKPSLQLIPDKPKAVPEAVFDDENSMKITVSSCEKVLNTEAEEEEEEKVLSASISMVDNVDVSPDDEDDDDDDEAVEEEEKVLSASIPMVDNVDAIPHDDDDDELRRRFEEFIEKINKGWRAEKMKTFL